MLTDLSYIQSSGLNDNKITYLRLEGATRVTGKNLYGQPIPGTNNSPNVSVDFIGTNNRRFTLTGKIAVRSGLIYPEGIGRILPAGQENDTRELDISGIGILEVTGSKVFFYDGIITTTARMNEGVLSFGSVVQVEVSNVNLGRSDDYTADSYEVGYVLPYSIDLEETK